MFDKIEDAIDAIKTGRMVIVLDDEDRENEGDLVMAAEFVTAEKINFMAKEGRGLICTPLSLDFAKRLNFQPMVQRNAEAFSCNFTVSVDYRHGTSTGISASDRAKTIKAILDEKSKDSDFVRPGHVFPLLAKDGGVLVRAGHTEASVDLCRLANLNSVGIICEIAADNGEMMRRDELLNFAKKHKLKIITIRDLIAYRRKKEVLVEQVAETDLPTEFGLFKMSIFKSKIDGAEHIAMVKGEIEEGDEVLVRVHSECITSEVFKSLKCDCSDQLNKALELISNEGKGVLLYMRQEGRGIGLVNKVKAYKLQNEGLDTVEANESLGVGIDLREYGIGAQILQALNCHKIKLLTNNPRKIVGLDAFDLNVINRIPLEVAPHELNKDYLKVKKEKLGHLFESF